MTIKEAFDKSLFLLGAGASYGTGCLMSKGMLDALKQEIIKDDDSVFNRPQKEALKFLLSCLDYHNSWRSFETNNEFIFTPNIEELALLIRRVKNRENFLPYPITGNWADKLIMLESEYRNLIDKEKRSDLDESLFDSLDRIIKQELFPLWLQFDHDKLSYLDPLKNMFVETSGDNYVMDIFSLNNDLVIETYFQRNNMMPFTGFSNNDWRGMGYVETENALSRINLCKLHGSLDWVRLTTGEVKVRDKCEDYESEMIDIRHNPYIVFGHGTKTFSVDPFFSMIHSFREKLIEKEYYFVIGYSFFDPYINNLLIEAVNKGNKKIIIINPSLGPDIEYNNQDGPYKEALDVYGQKVNGRLVEYIEAIQSNPFYSELPEFNVNKIHGENSIAYYKIGVSDFFSYYFSEEAKKFIELIDFYEREKSEFENPF